MRASILAVASLSMALAVCAEEAVDPAERNAAERDVNIQNKVERSIRRGCQWLARNQNKDGGLKSQYAVAATGLAGLSWLAAGSTPEAGPYASNIRRAIDFTIRSQGSTGFITEGRGYGNSSMYGHGFSALFLAEAYGMTRDENLAGRLKQAVVKSVRLIESTQNQFGGWNGTPDARQTDDGSGAVAIMQISALRAAESCGIHVKRQVVEKAEKYLLAMTSRSGWYAYNWGSRIQVGEDRGRAGTTGPGIYMLGAMNLHTDSKYEKGIKNLMKTAPFLTGAGGRGGTGQWYWFYYTCFYASLAIYQHGGAEWAKWYPAMVTSLINRQRRDGSFEDEYGGVYTALGVLSLSIVYRYLPMFQEGAAGREGR
jgi:hypothetical protein